MALEHLGILLKKNIFVLWNSKRLLLCHLLVPVFSCLLIVYIQMVADSFVKFEQTNPEIKESVLLPK